MVCQWYSRNSFQNLVRECVYVSVCVRCVLIGVHANVFHRFNHLPKALLLQRRHFQLNWLAGMRVLGEIPYGKSSAILLDFANQSLYARKIATFSSMLYPKMFTVNYIYILSHSVSSPLFPSHLYLTGCL